MRAGLDSKLWETTSPIVRSLDRESEGDMNRPKIIAYLGRNQATAIAVAALAAILPCSAADSPSVAGAIADTAPRIYQLSQTGNIQVFDGPRNGLFREKVQTFSQMSYAYISDVEVSNVRSVVSGAISVLSFDIGMRAVDRMVLTQKIRQSENPAARPELVTPVRFERLLVSLDGTTEPYVVNSGGTLDLGSPRRIQLSVPSSSVADLAALVRAGDLLPRVTIEVIQKLSSLSSYSIDWQRITSTKTFQDYFGPSGPEYITANQSALIAADMLAELHEFSWQEAPAADQAQLFDWVVAGFRNPTPIERDLSSSDWAKGLRVDTSDLLQLTNVINEWATDSKQLDLDQWCRKYKDFERHESSLDRKRGITIPIKKLVFGGHSDKTKTNTTTSSTETSDCGKKHVEDQFKFEMKGSVYVPKSIVVYQHLKGSARAKGAGSSNRFSIDQRVVSIDLAVNANSR